MDHKPKGKMQNYIKLLEDIVEENLMPMDLVMIFIDTTSKHSP